MSIGHGIGLGIVGALTPSAAPVATLELLLRGDLAFNASASQASVGQTVDSWRDQSGNTRHAAQGTDANRATYVTSDSAINNQPCLDFDGGDYYRGTLGAGTWADATLYVLWKIDATGTMAAFDSSDNDSTNRGLALFQQAPENVVRANTGVNGAAYNSSSTAWMLSVARLVDSSNSLELYEREVLKNTYALATDALPRTNYSIGALYNSGPLYQINGRIAEVRLYSSAHDATARTQTINYFATRYGI